MLDSLFLGAALALGQGAPLPMPPAPAGDAVPVTILAPPGVPGDPPPPPGVIGLPALATDTIPVIVQQPVPTPNPAAPPALPTPPEAPRPGTDQPKPAPTPAPETPKLEPNNSAGHNVPEPARIILSNPLFPAKPAVVEAPKAPAAAATRYLFMREVQGTWLGSLLDDNRTTFSGWLAGSFTGSTTQTTNQPVVWNDRANRFLFQQAWFRLDRQVLTSGTSDVNFGYHFDLLTGSDYRFTLQRGLFTGQLFSDDGRQQLYGVDPIQFYASMGLPNLFKGTEIRVGRLWTPWGVESLEAVSNPLISRSYAFNWSPPFTHMAIGAYSKYSDQWSSVVMLANGNDVFFVPEQEPRFVGALTYTGKQDAVTVAASIGRGVFNTSSTFAPTTVGLQSENAGRNNFNAFDLVWTHTFNKELAYSVEAIYAYQSSVPAVPVANRGDPASLVGAIISNKTTSGTAHWGAVANYLTWTPNPYVKQVTRFEIFDDCEGQRTGFEGIYYSFTAGLHFPLKPGFTWRNEFRYDYNNYSKPFEGSNNIKTLTTELQFRF